MRRNRSRRAQGPAGDGKSMRNRVKEGSGVSIDQAEKRLGFGAPWKDLALTGVYTEVCGKAFCWDMWRS